jgi:HEAT repeat protein
VTPHSEDQLRALDAASWPTRHQAFQELFAQGASTLATVIAGATHPRPRVRAACVALLDHLADERCADTLLAALRDPSPLVRRHAVHSIGCQRCKPRPLGIDIVGALIERMTEDSSPRVRRVAAHQLGLQPSDQRAVEALEKVLATAGDPGLVARARHAVATLRDPPTAPRAVG